MRLLVDARTGWGQGIGRVVANTVPRVAQLRPDWQVDVLVPPAQRDAAAAAFDGAPLTIVPCPITPFSPGEQVGLQSYARGHDLTWFTNYWVPLAWRGRFVTTVHDMMHLRPDLVPASPLRRALARRTFAKVQREAKGVMFVSRTTAAAFERMVGAPRGRAAVVPLGGDHLAYGARRPLAARSRRLLVVAASKQHKNFALLFEAWRSADVPAPWVLTVISPRELMLNSVDLDELARGDPRIEIRRSLSNEALAELYADSAILLMPSLYEGFGLPLLEGMMSGAWCISSNADAMVEVAGGSFVQFVNGADRGGWIAAIEGACAIVDARQPDLEPLLEHNLARAGRYRWDRTAEGIVDVIAAAA